jgi:hypothetical protein
MKFFIRISVMRVIVMMMLLACFLPILYAQNQTDIPAASLPEWIRNHMALIGLIVSEAMAFLPAKVSGIAQACWTIFTEIFKKKST